MKHKKLYLTIILTFIATFLAVSYLVPYLYWIDLGMFVSSDNPSLFYDTWRIIGLIAGISVVWYIIYKYHQSKLSNVQINIFLIASIIILSLFMFLWLNRIISIIDGFTLEDTINTQIMESFPEEPLQNFVIIE